MKLKLTYQQIINLDAALKSVGENKKNPKFSIAVARNRYALREHVECITEAGKPSDEMKKGDARRRELFNEHASPGDSGQMKIDPEAYPKFKAAVDKLKKELKPVDDAHEDQMLAYEKLLSTCPVDDKGNVVEIETYQISESMLPKDLSGNQIDGIIQLLKFK